MKYIKLSIIWMLTHILADALQMTPEQSIYGSIHHVKVHKGQAFIDIAEQYGIGVDALEAANPHVPVKHLKAGTQLLLPTMYILPSIRDGIVINLPEKRLYYFSKNTVYIFPVAIGRVHHESSVGLFSITEKRYLPIWTVPASVLKEERAKGNYLPAVFQNGPENPLGDYAMRLSHGSTLIHSTNFTPSIGKRSTSGCFSMYHKDIEKLFSLVSKGTKVTVINEPIKIATTASGIYIESHPTLQQTNNHGFRQPSASEIHYNIAYYEKKFPQVNPLDLYAVFSENMGVPLPMEKTHATRIHKTRFSSQ